MYNFLHEVSVCNKTFMLFYLILLSYANLYIKFVKTSLISSDLKYVLWKKKKMDATENRAPTNFTGPTVSERKRAANKAAGKNAGYVGSRSAPRKSRELVASVNRRFARTAPRIRRQRIPTIR